MPIDKSTYEALDFECITFSQLELALDLGITENGLNFLFLEILI